MTKPKMIGSIGCYSASPARFGRRPFSFNGTTLGLVRTAIAMGAKVGDVIHADFGAGFRAYELYANQADDRAGGVWARLDTGKA